MKRKLFIVVAALILLFVWYASPTCFLKDMEDAASIRVFNASNGHRFVIEDGGTAAHIVKNIQSQRFQRRELSLFMKGSLYHLSFCDIEGKERYALILNSDKWIRKDPFSYYTEGDMEILDLLREWKKKAWK